MGAPAGEKGHGPVRAQVECGVKAYVSGHAIGEQRTRIMSSLVQNRRHGQGRVAPSGHERSTTYERNHTAGDLQHVGPEMRACTTSRQAGVD